jgi:hypothetical protein
MHPSLAKTIVFCRSGKFLSYGCLFLGIPKSFPQILREFSTDLGEFSTGSYARKHLSAYSGDYQKGLKNMRNRLNFVNLCKQAQVMPSNPKA